MSELLDLESRARKLLKEIEDEVSLIDLLMKKAQVIDIRLLKMRNYKLESIKKLKEIIGC